MGQLQTAAARQGNMMINVSLAPSARLVRRLSFGAAVSAGLVVLSLTPAEAAKTTLNLGMTIEPAGLDPTIAAPVAIGQVTWQNVFEGLVTIDEAGKVQPQLAKSWEISPDGLTYTLKLRDGVTFHDGVSFDSSVAKFSIERARGADS